MRLGIAQLRILVQKYHNNEGHGPSCIFLFSLFSSAMSFYLKQPRGTIQLHILKKCVDQRLEFFDDVISHNKLLPSNNFEYLIEDTAFDRAGHFVLRLKAACSSSFGSYFHGNEVRLLDRRLQAYKVGSVVAFLKTLSRHANECYRESSNSSVRLRYYLVALVEVLAKMLRRSYRRHAFDELHEAGDRCELFTLYGKNLCEKLRGIVIVYRHITSLLFLKFRKHLFTLNFTDETTQ